MTVDQSVKLHAYYYFYGLGLNVTAIKNEWTDYNKERGDKLKSPYCKPVLNHWPVIDVDNFNDSKLAFNSLDWDNSVGVGLMLGRIDAIDFDGCISFELIVEVLKTLNLPADYEWLVRSGSGKGYHILFNAENDIICSHWNATYFPNQDYIDRFERFELRVWDHLVLPPSLHKSGRRYEFCSGRLPSTLPVEIARQSLLDFVHKFSDQKVQFVDMSTAGVGIRASTATHPQTLVIDVETNGLPIDREGDIDDLDNWPRVLQVAWVVLNANGSVSQKRMYFINHVDLNINEDVCNLTSIDDLVLKNHGVPIEFALRQLNEDAIGSSRIVAHNLDFDMKVISAEFNRLSINNDLERKKKFCTMKESVDLCRIPSSYGYKFPKLEELYYHLFNNSIKQNHRADADVTMTAKCYMRMNDIEIPVRMLDPNDDQILDSDDDLPF